MSLVRSAVDGSKFELAPIHGTQHGSGSNTNTTTPTPLVPPSAEDLFLNAIRNVIDSESNMDADSKLKLLTATRSFYLDLKHDRSLQAEETENTPVVEQPNTNARQPQPQTEKTVTPTKPQFIMTEVTKKTRPARNKKSVESYTPSDYNVPKRQRKKLLELDEQPIENMQRGNGFVRIF